MGTRATRQQRSRTLSLLALLASAGCIPRQYTYTWSRDGAPVVDGEAGARVDASDASADATLDVAHDGALDEGGPESSADAPDAESPDALEAAVTDAAGNDADTAPLDASETSALDAGFEASSDASSDAASDAGETGVFDAARDADAVDARDGAELADGSDAADTADARDANTADTADAADAADATSVDAGVTDATSDAGSCPPGTVPVTGGCEIAAAAVRRIAPLSGATVATRRPRLRWAPPPSGEPLALRLCSDRFCATTLRRDAVSGGSYDAPESLAHGVYFWRLEPATLGSMGVPPGYATTWEFVVSHDHPEVSAASWGALPDYDGDGLGDYAVGDPSANGGSGAVYIASGVRGTLPTFTTPVAIARPADAPRAFGTALANGDVNGDGYVDLLIGAPGTEPTERGRVYVQFGGPVARALFVVTPASVGDGFGSAIASSADVNLDGYTDVVVGAPRAAEARGFVALLTGGPTGLTPSLALEPQAMGTALPEADAPRTAFGTSVAFLGDATGDGYPELAVGAPSSSVGGAPPNNGTGYVLIVERLDSPTATMATAFLGLGPAGQFGFAVGLGGDVDDDTHPDFLVGAPGINVGCLYLSTGTSALVTDRPTCFGGANPQYTPTTSRLGASVGGGYDVNGDGLDDPIFGQPAWSSGLSTLGFARIVIGNRAREWTVQSSGLPTTVSFGAGFGTSVTMLGDTNGDTLAEAVFAAPGQAGGGAVFLEPGRGGWFDGMRRWQRLPSPTTAITRLGDALAH